MEKQKHLSAEDIKAQKKFENVVLLLARLGKAMKADKVIITCGDEIKISFEAADGGALNLPKGEGHE